MRHFATIILFSFREISGNIIRICKCKYINKIGFNLSPIKCTDEYLCTFIYTRTVCFNTHTVKQKLPEVEYVYNFTITISVVFQECLLNRLIAFMSIKNDYYYVCCSMRSWSYGQTEVIGGLSKWWTSSGPPGPMMSPDSSLALFSFFHFILLFWNQILIWRSVRHSAWAISIRLLRVR